jgi:hypothetical protein
MSGAGAPAHEQWWLATLGRNIVWARLRVREAGTAEVFDADGNTLAYDSEDTSRAALLDAEFVEYDGLDAEDALERGFHLAEVRPPSGGDDAAVRPQMFVSLGGRD